MADIERPPTPVQDQSSPRLYQRVPDREAVVTTPELRELCLGIYTPLKLVCCTHCPKLKLLNFPTCVKHVREHVTNAALTKTRRVQTMLRSYGVYEGYLSDLPQPHFPSRVYPGLPTEKMFMCIPCKENSQTIWLASNERARSDHMKSEHPKLSLSHNRDTLEEIVYAQTFCPGYKNNSYWFPVYPDLAGPQDDDNKDDDLFVTAPKPPGELSTAFREEYEPVHLPRLVPSESLKDTNPLLYWTSFAAHIAAFDPEMLCALLQLPNEEDPLHRLVDVTKREFDADQKTLHRRFESLRVALLNDGSGRPPKTFIALSDSVGKTYSVLLARFFVFILRLYQMILAANNEVNPVPNPYPITFTAKQMRACMRMEQYVQLHERRRRGRDCILRLARAFWAPDSPSEFHHLAEDQFNDVTARFTVLVNLRPDGSFQNPRDISHNVSAIKYIMRASLYMSARDQYKAGKLPPDQIIPSIAPYLSRFALTPFAALCVVGAHAAKYANTSVGLPNVLWTGPTTLSVDGYPIDFLAFRASLTALILETETLILQKLFKGVSPESMGFKITESTVVYDQPDKMTPGYSLFSDSRNPFHAMTFNLASALFEHRPGFLAHGTHKTDDNYARVTWNEEGVDEWLRCYTDVVKRLSAAIFMVGGQPARGVESCLVKIVNMVHRLRGVFMLKPGVLIFVLMYGKTTSNTTYDRIVAHAVPWRLGRLFLMLNALARPLAGYLVGRIKGYEKRLVQETSAFPLLGAEMTSEQLSAQIREFFQQRLQADIGIASFRHFIVGSQRRLMPEAFAPILAALTAADAQGRHTSETSGDFYALAASELHLLKEFSLLKQCAVSQRWAPTVVPDLLTATERENADKALGTINSDLSNVSGSAPLTHEMLVRALIEALVSERVMSVFEERMRSVFSTELDKRFPTGFREATTGHRDVETPTRPVESKHSVLLQRYTGNQNATWKSPGQATALVEVLARQKSLLVVLPTGGGKSFLFGSLPLIESGISVVIFPLRALMQDQIQVSRVRQEALVASGQPRGRDITLIPWVPNFDGGDGVYAVSADVASKSGFRLWLTRQSLLKKLNRIFFDEVHLVHMASDYRSIMSDLNYLTSEGVPIVGLSASAPPALESSIRSALGNPSWVVIRERTQRLNLVLHTAKYRSKTEATRALLMHAQRFETELKPGEGMMIVCRSWSEVEEIGKHLDALMYHGQMEETARDANLDVWLSGDRKTIVGSSGLGTGIHHAAARVVLHNGPSYTMTDYFQETGRAGRDGLPGVCVLYDYPNRGSGPKEDLGGWAQLTEMLDDTTCIRYHLSKYMDGMALASSCAMGEGFKRCSRCILTDKQAAGRDGVALAGPDQADQGSITLPDKAWVVEHLPTFAPIAVQKARAILLNSDTEQENPAELPPSYKPARMPIAAPLTGQAGPSNWAGATSHITEAEPTEPREQVPMYNPEDRGHPVVPPFLDPPQPVGPSILADTHAAQLRQRVIVPPRELHTISQTNPYTFETLLHLMRDVHERCPYCLTQGVVSLGHTLGSCSQSPSVFFSLEGIEYQGE